MKSIYLDNSATTKPSKEVLKKMDEINSRFFGNASSIHSFGQSAREVVDQARSDIAKVLNSKPSEIIFTSGGSESDNLAIKGVAEGILKQVQSLSSTRSGDDNFKPHIITSEIEHHAVLNTVKELEKERKIEATYIAPGKNGVIKAEDVERAIKPNTILVSIMYVNNEIGTVQPIREIGKLIEKINLQKQEKNKKTHTSYSVLYAPNSSRIFFHTDAVQAPEYFDLNVDYLHVDLLSLSAHKFYGPKGVGILYKRDGVKLKHQIIGGSQEYKLRAGTENVAGIAGMAAALRQVESRKSKVESISNLRDRLMTGLLKISESRINGSIEKRLSNNVNISFKNAEGESILMMLDQAGIAASSGSACTSGSLEPSHVLTAIGVKPEWSHGSIRLTLGKDTTEEEIDKVIEVMPGIIKKLRKMSPLKN